MMQSISLGALALALVLSVGCGEDEAPSRRPAAARGGGGAKPAKAQGKGKAGPAMKSLPKIDDKLRRTFLEQDFRPDSIGDRNRDPFRSYIVRQPGLTSGETKTDDAENDVCRNTRKKQNWMAPTYSLRDLKLIGIIMRGTKGYAQFTDSSGDGWVVTQNNCLGVEKAIVTTIGAGVVRLRVQPEAPLGGTPPPPVQRDIALFPEEYDVEATTNP